MNLELLLTKKTKILFLIVVFFSCWAQAVERKADPHFDEEIDPILKEEPYDPANVLEKPGLETQFVEKAEELQQDITRQVFSLSDRIDAFFGDPRTDDEANKSTLGLNQAFYFSERNPQASNFEINLNLRFRNLEKFGEQIQKSIEDFFRSQGGRNTGKPSQKSGSATAAAAGKGKEAQQEAEPWYFNWENRVGVRLPLDLSSSFRWRRNFIGEVFIHRFYEQVGWSTRDEWASKTSWASDFDLGPKTLFRFSNEFNWYMTYKQFSTTHGPSILHTIGERDSISYDIRETNVLLGSAWYVDVATVGVNYRRQMDLRWLFFEVNPQITLSRAQNFRRDFNTTFRFEVVMGNL